MPSYEQLVDMQIREQEVYDNWIPGHETDSITHRAFSPDNYDQRITSTFLEATPSLERARQLAELGVGGLVYTRLVDEFQDAAAAAKEGSEEGYSTLVASLHLDNVQDVVISHNALFVASNDKRFADRNIILVNPLMARLQMAGAAITDVIRQSGGIIFGIPSDGAEKHGMPSDVIEFRNRNAALQLGKLFRDHGPIVLHWAPSGTRTKTAKINDREVKIVPRVSDNDAHMLVKRTPLAIGVPMKVGKNDTVAKVFEPRFLKSADDVHELMQDMTETISELTRQKVIYGLPLSARSSEPAEAA